MDHKCWVLLHWSRGPCTQIRLKSTATLKESITRRAVERRTPRWIDMIEQAPRKLTTAKMPGHWLLARLGKRVLRPGGIELTRQLLSSLNIQPGDHVVEFAPGLGVTARLTLEREPASYTAIERDEAAADIVRRYLVGPKQQCVIGHAEETGLDEDTYDVVYGEAMLSMQTAERKIRILSEAHRLLKPGGLYGIHELCLIPDDIDQQIRKEIESRLTHSIHHRVELPTLVAWRHLLEAQGFVVRDERTAPMHLLEPKRLIEDEGLGRALRFGWNLIRDRDARKRVLAMRRLFKTFSQNLAAVMLVAVKPGEKDH